MGASFHSAKTAKKGVIDGRFTALPVLLIKSAQYRKTGHTARSLLFDLSVQNMGTNNGSLVLCQKAMRPLGWASNDTLNRATNELITNGLIVRTRQGRKPNLASWFALAWLDLKVITGLDIDPKAYRRMVYEDYKPEVNNDKAPRKATMKKTKIAET